MTLIDKINSRSAKIGVIGLGYVGLPLVIEFCRAGFGVCGFDVDETKVSLLNAGKSYIRHIDLSTVENELKGRFTAHDEYRDLDFNAFNIPIVDTRNAIKDKPPLFFKA